MKIHIEIEDELPPLELLLEAAYYSGERTVLRGRDGVAAVIVPMEDLELLEQIEEM